MYFCAIRKWNAKCVLSFSSDFEFLRFAYRLMFIQHLPVGQITVFFTDYLTLVPTPRILGLVASAPDPDGKCLTNLTNCRNHTQLVAIKNVDISATGRKFGVPCGKIAKSLQNLHPTNRFFRVFDPGSNELPAYHEIAPLVFRVQSLGHFFHTSLNSRSANLTTIQGEVMVRSL